MAHEVTERFSMHRRTLARHLHTLGTGYRTIADQVRFDVAQQLLAETDIPLVQISAALDFSEPAAFTHAFERWSGVAPSAWGTVNLLECGRNDARDQAGDTDGYARAATPVTAAQVWKAWVRAARYWAAGR